MTNLDYSIFDATKDLIIFGVALLGAGLGVLNYWRVVDREKVRLRVVPQGYFSSSGESGICVDVVNLSAFPVTVSQVAFDLRGGNQIFIILPTTAYGGKNAPQRLEPRASFTTHFSAGKERCGAFADVTHVFAKTACGAKFTGTTLFLESCIKAARAAK